jgi:hypothetical protein
MHKLAEVMYRAASGPTPDGPMPGGPMPGGPPPGQGPTGKTGGAGHGRDDVIDAEFEEA